jgi:hypothetical protein
MPHGPYTREQITAAGRPATCEPLSPGADRYRYDGINFWHTQAEHSFLAIASEAPPQGWWHKETCTCPLCRGETTQ